MNRTLWTGDNLDVMRSLDDDIVDLIYLDPPFNSNRNYAAPVGSKAAGAAFKDTWELSDTDLAWHGAIAEAHPELYRIIEAARFTHGESMMSYLVMMGIRLLEMKRILKPTGSIYLHCDPTASHYLKIAMDSVWGRDKFRNEIVWGYPPTGRPPTQGLPRKHDIILFYSGKGAVWNQPYTPVTEATLKAYSSVDEDGRRYSKAHGKRTYLDQVKGRACPSWWTDIGSGSHMPKAERLGYPTQKPLKLLDRIIKASTNPNDLVFDPFCGCATSLAAAEHLGRQWLGVDISEKSIGLVKRRLREDGVLHRINHCRDFMKDDSKVGEVPTVRYNDRVNKEVLFGRQQGVCKGCDGHFAYKQFEVDHIVPRASGGGDELDNLQLLCRQCNGSKGAKSHEEFLEYKVREAERAAAELRRKLEAARG